MENFNKVIIGTANFSEDYKILDQKKTFSSKKISSILADSKKLNIDTIDTSYNYRGVESKLGKYNLKNWKIITKLPKLNLLENIDFNEIDLLFLALPHKISQEFVNKNISKIEKLKIIDLSADFRLDLSNDYKKNYNSKHICLKLLNVQLKIIRNKLETLVCLKK